MQRFLLAAMSSLSLSHGAPPDGGAGGGSAGAAPPATPGGAPPAEERPSPIKEALGRAREALTGGKGLNSLSAPAPAAPAAPPKPNQPPAGTNPPAPKAGAPAPSPDGGEAPPEAGADADAPPADGTAPPDGAAGDAGDDVDPELVAEVPARFPDEEPVQIVVEDKETADRIRQLARGYMRGNEVREAQQRIAAREEETEAIRTAMEVDPVGFALSNQLTEDQQINLAISLLTDERLWAKLQPVMRAALTKPEALVAIRAEARADRAELREQAEGAVQTRRAVQRNVRELNSALDAIVPDTLSDVERDLFIQDCRTDISVYAQANRLLTLDPRDLPKVLARRLATRNITPEQALRLILTPPAQRASRQPARQQVPTGKTTSEGAPASGTPPTRKTPTGADFVRGQQKKAQVAASAPAGAGAPSSTIPKPPAGTNLKGAFAHARQVLRGNRSS